MAIARVSTAVHVRERAEFAMTCRDAAHANVLEADRYSIYQKSPTRGPLMKTTAMSRTGYVLTAVFALFMLGASVAPKLLGMPVAEDTMRQLGWPAGYAFGIGVVELLCLVLYLIPRTNVLGAVLFMGLFGGAMATQVRAGNPLFSHVLFSIYLGILMWGGLWLRDPAVRAMFPVRSPR
jgi:hypothetical protein